MPAKFLPLQKRKAQIAVISANLIFGINYSAVQYITRGFVQPFALNLIRVGVSTLLLWMLWIFSSSGKKLEIKHIGRLFLCAVTGIVVNQSLFVWGLSMTLSIHAALLILVTPVFITLVAFWMRVENLTPLKVFGLIAGIAGATMLALQKEHAAQASDILWGDILIIINSISYAFYFVLVKPLMKLYKPTDIIRWVFTIGLLMIVPIGWNQFRRIEWASFSWIEFGTLTFIVLGATFLAYLFNLYGIHRLGAGITGAYIYTQPVFATLIAVFFLGESLTVYKIGAGALIFGGVYLVNRKNE